MSCVYLCVCVVNKQSLDAEKEGVGKENKELRSEVSRLTVELEAMEKVGCCVLVISFSSSTKQPKL